MKYTSSTRKAARVTTHTSNPDASAGPKGLTIAPPAYGIDIVDASEAELESGLNQGIVLQPKLTLGEPRDKYEQEADRVAPQVVEQINVPSFAQEMQSLPVLRREAPDKKLLTKLSPGPERVEATPEGEVSTGLESVINQVRRSGQPLDKDLQRSMGQAMGADFSGVRIHTDALANQLNQSLQAKAFTTGKDVFFKQGEYHPNEKGGQELIAHELTHVVQQKGTDIQRQTDRKQWSPQVHINIKGRAKDKISRAIEIDEKRYELLEVHQELKARYGYTPKTFPALNEILVSLDNKFFGDWKNLKDEIEDLKVSRHLTEMEAAAAQDLKWVGPMQSMMYGLRKWLRSDNAPEPTQMNCFQTVLFTAVKAGIINKKYMQQALKATGDYESNPLQAINLVRAIIANKAGRIEGWKSQNDKSVKGAYQQLANANIPAGHVVLFGDDGEHVAISTGEKRMPSNAEKFKNLGITFGQHEMLENNKGNADELGTATDVRKTTVEDAFDTYLGTTKALTWGPLPTGKQLSQLL